MTLRGLLVTILELLLLVLALGTDFKNFLFVALCIGGLLLYSIVSLLLASVSLGAKSTIDKITAIRTEMAEYTFTVKGVALLPVASYFFVKTTDGEYKEKRKFRHSFLLLPTLSVKREFVFKMPCSHVGEWEVGIKKMRVEDLFGFFSIPLIRCKRSNLLKKISVMPKIHDLSEITERESAGGFGSTNLLNSEDGELLGDSRIYHEGDALRRINWKLSARAKKLYSRLFETPQEATVTIVMDTAVYGDKSNDVIDITCEAVTSLAKYFVEQNNIVKVVMAQCKGKTAIKSIDVTSLNDVLNMQDNFTYLEFNKCNDELTLSMFEGMQIFSANRIYFITSNPSDELITTLEGINKTGKVAHCIVPSPELLDGYSASVVGLSNAALVDIASADQIKERVGAAL